MPRNIDYYICLNVCYIVQCDQYKIQETREKCFAVYYAVNTFDVDYYDSKFLVFRLG